MSFQSVWESFKSGASSAANTVSREAGNLSRAASHAVNSHWSSPLLSTFENGNTVQLVSRSSSKAIQLDDPLVGDAVLDAKADPTDVGNKKTHWISVDTGKNIIQIKHGEYYIAIVNGATVLQKHSDSALAGEPTKFRLAQSGNFVTFESLTEEGRHLGFLADGELKSALVSSKDADSQFGVRLIASSVPPKDA
eukprot:GHVU01003574.1.p1 GENE.GHVU01003574.1~~GHVU01003574.1.p1  ORF type:complete len:194 (+),score=17.37 GHVU01003574.1:212-793(+)